MGIRLAGQDDPRHFRHFAKMAPDGSVAAVVEVADGSPDPLDTTGSVYIDITDIYPYDLRTVKANPLDVQKAAEIVTVNTATQGITVQSPTPVQLAAIAAIKTMLTTAKVIVKGAALG